MVIVCQSSVAALQYCAGVTIDEGPGARLLPGRQRCRCCGAAQPWDSMCDVRVRLPWFRTIDTGFWTCKKSTGERETCKRK